ncbi:LOB domain-containing protein 22 [Prunus dulcis]|uniref:LOB domain-containing protein 22 n=1 Tax=Prunus dulcis TaxID=3755 RepID=A0A4Y1R4G8_PRUDU|nr:LOB domain-containing protein 22 [Prunus dulcis]
MENRDQGAAQNHACASCNHQRRKCDETCEMAPYFPASRYNEFQNAHKIFCVSNIQKIMAMAAPDQRQAAAESILTEGECKEKMILCVVVLAISEVSMFLVSLPHMFLVSIAAALLGSF